MATLLISVYEKTGLVDFLQSLRAIEPLNIIATTSTAQYLKENNFDCTLVEAITAFPEILGGRVKTLHPKIFGGILARSSDADQASLYDLGIPVIDFVIVNLYPFEAKLKEGLNEAQMMEFIDIGGVSLLRAAAKNHERVSILSDPRQYSAIAQEFASSRGKIAGATRRKLAQQSFQRTAAYDGAITQYFLSLIDKENEPASKIDQQQESFAEQSLPIYLDLNLERYQPLRYGENPHQTASWYAPVHTSQYVKNRCAPSTTSDFPPFIQHQGKELSCNNITDTYCLVKILREFTEPAACIIKHNNPCGIALGKTIEEAFTKAYNTDPTSAFGGVYGFTAKVTKKLAREIVDGFVEIVAAPSFEPDALDIFRSKKNLRVLQFKESVLKPVISLPLRFKDLQDFGWIIEQDTELSIAPPHFERVAGSAIETNLLENGVLTDVAFAWAVVKHLTSNAIFIAKDGCSIGFGIGQTSRIASVEIALEQAQSNTENAVLASDAFFPAIDNVEAAAKAGIKIIVQPGGSLKDKEVIAASERLGIQMLFTGQRFFKH